MDGNAGSQPLKINTVYTVRANCRDCYRCVRVCPVKAISVKDGQASIREDLCIKCGTCVRECPQHAKTIISSLDEVKALIASGKKVAASVAPSFPAAFPGWRTFRLPSALRKLGFACVSETAEGAGLVAKRSFEKPENGSICTACPAMVNYVEKYKPEYLDRLKAIVSPMIAHGRMLKKRLGPDWRVVFIGPCAAKKSEATRPEYKGVIDYVLTFTELSKWLEQECIELATCEASGFESMGKLDVARLFPLAGGMMKTGSIFCDNMENDRVATSGATEVINLLNVPLQEWKFEEVECLFCESGCINGPGMPDSIHDSNLYKRKQDLLSYASSGLPAFGEMTSDVECRTSFSRHSGKEERPVSESDIQKVLEQTGKSNSELQLNCGACGYKSCRDNAIAVARGLAEPEMCMPFMRRLAQQRTDRIIETSPNGIVVLDEELHIIKTNPAFLRMFHCANNIIGRRISYFMDACGFEKLVAGEEKYEAIKSKYGMKYHEQLYTLRNENQYVGIFTDISKVSFDEKQLDIIKQQTLVQARELLSHQIHFSQEMAHFLGRYTAKSEELVQEMVELYQNEKQD
jgi:iron only hydrogenase large subunit-like protein/uncharacterized Fe-S cluster-containing protein